MRQSVLRSEDVAPSGVVGRGPRNRHPLLAISIRPIQSGGPEKCTSKASLAIIVALMSPLMVALVARRRAIQSNVGHDLFQMVNFELFSWSLKVSSQLWADEK